MKIENITLTNFRQYHGKNPINLLSLDDKNIILIGGKNGYGKTNFLLSLVWCLYGEDIAKIDENFKHEIQKEGNYYKFLKSSLNWDANKEGQTKFSVEICVSGIELPEIQEQYSKKYFNCYIKREFDVSSSIDEFDIKIDEVTTSFLESNEEKINFINDYIIPIEAAKFVFFDAEKIASWAELSTKEEGNVLNDALGKILGLDIYESLAKDLHLYTDGLRKESATAQVRQQIITTERGIELNVEKIDNIESDIINKESEITKIKSDIAKYESFLVKHSGNVSNSYTLDELYKKRNDLKNKEKELQNKFNEFCEIIPFAIAAGKIEEVTLHLKMQEEDNIIKEKQSELINKSQDLIEKLFNAPPFPNDGDISFTKKTFYADKAKKIVEEIFGQIEDVKEFSFEHDLTKSDKELVNDTFDFIGKQSKEIFEYTIENFNKVKEESIEVDRLIKKIESNLEDEEITEYSTKKNDAERKLEKLIEEKGSLHNQKLSLKRENDKLNQSLQIFIKRISVSEQKRKKLDKANLYIKSLEDFVSEQISNKCAILEKLIFKEMQKLMHKLYSDNHQNFIAAVKAETLPDNDGLRIILYNKEGEIRLKESLSQGEKQIYISSLIKAILSLSIQEYPIFIDTPLGRLDDEHIKHILLYYYPDLASQVILMATNNEIPPSRYKMVKDNVAQAYLLENINNKTKFKQGYFQSYED
jgi:DNA sulfur modification protein DndD